MILTKLPWVLFKTAETIYGISCESVTSFTILNNIEVTGVPKVPEHIRGVANLRGKIISLVDMRKLLGLKSFQEEFIEFKELMEKRKQDHINWLTTLEKSVEENTEFSLTTNPHACAFGKWYDNYETDNLSLKFLLKKFDKPHKKIHSIAVDVKKLQENKDFTGAREIIERVKDKELKEMINLFSSVITEFKESRPEIVIVLENNKNPVGVIVDEVTSVEVLTKIDEEYEGSVIEKENILAIGKRRDDTPVFLLNTDHLISNSTEQALQDI